MMSAYALQAILFEKGGKSRILRSRANNQGSMLCIKSYLRGRRMTRQRRPPGGCRHGCSIHTRALPLLVTTPKEGDRGVLLGGAGGRGAIGFTPLTILEGSEKGVEPGVRSAECENETWDAPGTGTSPRRARVMEVER